MKLQAAFAKIEAKGGCATGGDVGTVGSKVGAFVDELVTALIPVTTSTVAPPGPTTTTTLPVATVSFGEQVQPIFTGRCALPGCHAGPSAAVGMNLSAGRAYSEIVGVPSVECVNLLRVEPGVPEASYVVAKIEGVGPCFSGGRMPLGQPPLSPTEIEIISTWIAEGAADN